MGITGYLAGGIRGYKHFNFPAFDAARDELRAMGHTVFSPADNDRRRFGWAKDYLPDTENETVLAEKLGITPDLLRRLLFHDDMSFICSKAQCIWLLKGWEKSSGATAESATGIALGLKRYIQTDEGWVEVAPNGGFISNGQGEFLILKTANDNNPLQGASANASHQQQTA